MARIFRVFFDIFFGYFLLIPNLIFFVPVLENIGIYKYILLFLLCAWNGIIFHYLTLFIHAAAHFNIYPNNRKINDYLSNFLLGYFFLMPIKSYRKKHFKHHKYLGTVNDPEDSYKYNLNTINFLKWCCFYFPIKKLFLMFFSNENNKSKFEFEVIISIIVFSSIHLLILNYFINISSIELYFFLLFIPHTMILPVMNWIRTSVEHSPVEINNKSFALRNFDNGSLIISFLFGAAGFKFHDIHHLNPGIHYLDLFDYKNKFKLQPSTSYAKTISKLYHKSKK